MKITLYIVIFCAIFGLSYGGLGGLIGRKQRVSARGRFVCGDKPAHDVLVKLVDIDTGTIDDKMDEKRTNRNGEFTVSGEETEVTDIDPVLKIYHDCNKGTFRCPRKWKITVPKSFINSNKVLDIGTWNLEVILPEESHDCIHRK